MRGKSQKKRFYRSLFGYKIPDFQAITSLVIVLMLTFISTSCINKDPNLPSIADYTKPTETVEVLHGSLLLDENAPKFKIHQIVPSENLVVRLEKSGIVYVDHVDYEARYKERIVFEIPAHVLADTLCDQDLKDIQCTYLFECYTKIPEFEFIPIKSGCLKYRISGDTLYVDYDLNISHSFGGLLDKGMEAGFTQDELVLLFSK